MKSYNQWLISLGSERRDVVSQDKHMLAESAYDSIRLESIDGNLHKYLVHFSLIKNYSESEIISSEHRRLFFSMLEDFRKFIRDVLEDSLWSLMQIFGSSFHLGMHEVPFKNNELEVTDRF